MTDLDAVVFDLDGTLCVSTQDDADVHEAIFERTGAPEFFDLDDLYAIDWTALPDADSTREHYENAYREIAARVGEGVEHAPALAEATVAVLDPAAVRFRDGAETALEAVRERYPVALLTAGSPASQRPKLERLGVADAFETVVYCGTETALETKPHPEPFERVLGALETAPGRTVYVGDRHDGDVVGAHRAGMQSVWVPTDGPAETPEPAPTHRLDSLADLPDVL